MSATEELRRLLDERGVEYDRAATINGGTVATFWYDRDGYPCSAIEGADDIPSGEVSVQACITPEQAVAATLGRGTCKVVSRPHDMWECECGKAWWHGGTPNFCPNCGACVVEEVDADGQG